MSKAHNIWYFVPCPTLNLGITYRPLNDAHFQVRHPNILSFLHSTEIETSDGGSSKVTVYIVTEPVMPLSEKIKELGLEGTQRYELICLIYKFGLGCNFCDSFNCRLTEVCKTICKIFIDCTIWVLCEALIKFVVSFIPDWCCRDEYYAWGLNQIAKAVSFLNNDCKLVSNLDTYTVIGTHVVCIGIPY